MNRYLIIIEKANGNYSAYSPDVPGCIATGATRDEAEREMHKALQMHIDGIREDGLPLPEPSASVSHVEAQCQHLAFPLVLKLSTCSVLSPQRVDHRRTLIKHSYGSS